MIIDAHQHFWQLDRGDYAWPNDSVKPIFRDFGPVDLAPHLAKCGVKKTVLVQATDSVAETRFLLNLADTTEHIAAVVGWVDLLAKDAPAQIAVLAQHPRLCGFRPMLQSISQTDWILQEGVAPALTELQQQGLCFDALIQPRHLCVIAQLADQYPDLPIVIDHMAKPKMRKGAKPDQNWCDGIALVAKCANINIKLSGMVTEFDGPWDMETIRLHFQHVLNCFGPERMIFGSDWPVSNLRCSYQDWFAAVAALTVDLSNTERAAILGHNAANFYSLAGD